MENLPNSYSQTLDLVFYCLDSPIAFHRCFATICGNVNAALFLSQAFYWARRCDGEWFYKTADEWQHETSLTRKEQASARRILLARGFLSEKLAKSPAVLHFKVEIEPIYLALSKISQFSPKVKTGFTKRSNQDFPKGENPIRNTETTTETTTEELRLFPSKEKPEQQAVQKVFAYYREVLGKSNAYTLTPKRLKMGVARFREALGKLNGNRSDEKAVELMTIAVDALHSSDFHMARGKYEGHTAYNDWEQLFRSPEKFEQWLERA